MKITTGNSTDKTNKENPDYVSEDWNIIKAAEEIQADVKKIKQGDATTIAEYTKIFTRSMEMETEQVKTTLQNLELLK